jgi:DNA-3-methyladenine glycosylase
VAADAAEEVPGKGSRLTEVLGRDFYARDSLEVAGDLIGRMLIRTTGGRRLMGRIVEAEAYARDDPASHAFRGPTPRNASMFGPPGHAYVYRSHGIHHCLNVTTGDGSAVLLRALEPVRGLGEMAEQRGLDDPRLLCAGPGRLCQALGVSLADDGRDLTIRRKLWMAQGEPAVTVVATPRVGISVAIDRRWRFVEEGSAFLSRPLPRLSAVTPLTR